MKKKIIGFVMVVAIAITAGWNVYQNEKEIGLSDLALANVEALANCESAVEFKRGRAVKMTCVNTSGSSYILDACDFDDNYPGMCQGRKANS
ncbi:hypothetical protein M2480_002141 [Parabacteroides sp. PFB2-12]|uniref:NVEALA domain-containing protein n=1 Tax=unclassified Parabacteroides TaxID=2649774 RepID=UPI002474C36D|nr:MULTISPECIES: NVEALA domain-containing protein [unclassified Parabacteroides]MDH6342165.1 hypothetical protein [Parabacteroides sp. PM6-13]MDH6391151.1 hypothetical protein [Parabacteroides sp. PFB2-12]